MENSNETERNTKIGNPQTQVTTEHKEMKTNCRINTLYLIIINIYILSYAVNQYETNQSLLVGMMAHSVTPLDLT